MPVGGVVRTIGWVPTIVPHRNLLPKCGAHVFMIWAVLSFVSKTPIGVCCDIDHPFAIVSAGCKHIATHNNLVLEEQLVQRGSVAHYKRMFDTSLYFVLRRHAFSILQHINVQERPEAIDNHKSRLIPHPRVALLVVWCYRLCHHINLWLDVSGVFVLCSSLLYGSSVSEPNYVCSVNTANICADLATPRVRHYVTALMLS